MSSSMQHHSHAFPFLTPAEVAEGRRELARLIARLLAHRWLRGQAGVERRMLDNHEPQAPMDDDNRLTHPVA